jgi:hypothetical protein
MFAARTLNTIGRSFRPTRLCQQGMPVEFAELCRLFDEWQVENVAFFIPRSAASVKVRGAVAQAVADAGPSRL